MSSFTSRHTMASEAPPRPVQLRFIHKLQKELTSATDHNEYAVSKQWVTALEQFLEDDKETASGDKVPPLFASDWDSDNMYVAEKSWKVLASWYCLDSHYYFRRRYIVSNYISIQLNPSAAGSDEVHRKCGGYVLADNKLDFLTSSCCQLKDLSREDVKQHYINIYFWESLDYVEFQLRCVLKIHPDKDVRMWLSFCDDGDYKLLENVSLYDQHVSIGAIICEKYPEVLNVLHGRQIAAPGAHLPYAVAGVTPFKEELSSVFETNMWRLTLCLEVLPQSVGAAQAFMPSLHKVPAVFHNLSLDHIFKSEAGSSDWDEELKQLLDDSVSDFSKLIREQKDKLQVKTEHLLKEAKESYRSLEQQCKIKMEEATMFEKRLMEREKELNERDHEINAKLAKFKSMLTEFLMNKERFEKEAAQLAQQNNITASKVELNVGGVRYTTSKSTLIKEEGSILQAMFKGQHALTPDADGSYFIDRDGTHFRYILNFLRDGSASLQHLPQGNLQLFSELRNEAEHYQLHKMVSALRVKMAEGNAGATGDCVSLPM